MNEERNRQEHLNHMKILFFIVARINGEYKQIDMNQEVIYVSRQNDRQDYDSTVGILKTKRHRNQS